jgi:predicted DNA-binding transcriptional regulator YafY
MATAWSDEALGEAARSAMAKIESILPRPLQTAIENTALFAPSGPWTRQYAAGLEALRRAISERRKLRCRYTRADGADTTRTIRPLGLYFWGAKWSLAAWCDLREGYRSFRPDRMKDVEVLGDRFEVTDRVSLAGFLEWHLQEEDAEELPFVVSIADATESVRLS